MPDKKFDLEAQKAKIASMLVKAERTDNDHERDAYTQKAEAMMLRLGIDAAELEAAGEVKPEEIVESRVLLMGVYRRALMQLAADIAQAYGHIRVLQLHRKSGRYYHPRTGLPTQMTKHTVCYVIGTKTDVEQFVALLESLVVQVQSARSRFRKETTDFARSLGMSSKERFNADYTFIVQFGIAVRDRLRQTRRTEEATASPGAALVLVGKQDRVNAVADDLSSGKVAINHADRFDALGAIHGREAGRTANLGEKSLGSGVAGTLD